LELQGRDEGDSGNDANGPFAKKETFLKFRGNYNSSRLAPRSSADVGTGSDISQATRKKRGTKGGKEKAGHSFLLQRKVVDCKNQYANDGEAVCRHLLT